MIVDPDIERYVADHSTPPPAVLSALIDHTEAIRRFNDMVLADDRVTSVLLRVRDGVTLVRQR